MRLLINLVYRSVVSHRTFASAKWGSKKQHRQIKLFTFKTEMADPNIEKQLEPLRQAVKEQVRYTE